MIETFKVIDNFLPKNKLGQIKDLMESPIFPWYYNDGVASEKDEDYYFTHIFYNNYTFQSSFSELIILPLLEKIQPQSIIRIKGNLYPRTEKIKNNKAHIDYKFKHLGAIYYVNSNDGYTILNDDYRIESIENRMLLFDPSLYHKSTHCTDKNYRMNINFNYF